MPIKALKAPLAGLGLVSTEGVRDCSDRSRRLSSRAAAAVMGAGFGRGRLPGLGEGSFEGSRRLDERLGGWDGLAKAAGEAVTPAVGDTVEMSEEGSEGLDEESAIKRPNLAFRNGGWKCLGTMGRKEGGAEATRYEDILAQWFLPMCGCN